jgi:hypothetical protein
MTLFQDRNLLKIVGIVVVLSATLLFSRCSEGYIYRSQGNARIAVQVICQEQVYNYEWRGYFLENIEAQGRFTNPYPEFYSHSTRYAEGKVFHYVTSRSPYLKSYVGLVVALPETTQPTPSESNSASSDQAHAAIAILCEADKPGATPATDPSSDTSTLTCGSQTHQVGDLIGAYQL